MSSTISPIAQNFPNPSAPFVNPDTGVLTDYAQNLLQSLWQRTGGKAGIDAAAVNAQANAGLIASNALSELSIGTRAARARQNLGLTGAATATPEKGWSAPSGAVNRGSINAAWTGTASSTYTQSESQALVTQVEALSGAVGALIEDLVAYGALSYGS